MPNPPTKSPRVSAILKMEARHLASQQPLPFAVCAAYKRGRVLRRSWPSWVDAEGLLTQEPRQPLDPLHSVLRAGSCGTFTSKLVDPVHCFLFPYCPLFDSVFRIVHFLTPTASGTG